jgi:NADH-quinone oxidoreductase subunit C
MFFTPGQAATKAAAGEGGWMAEEQKPEAAKPAAAGHAAPKAPAVMASTPWDSELAKQVKEQFGDEIIEAATYLGQSFFVVKPDAAVPLIEYLKLEADFDYLVDLTAAHFPERPEQFDIIYILYSFSRNERIRVKSRIKDGERPVTAVGVHLCANWFEREVFDMFGVRFEGHPDMKRLLLPEDWEGYPLRKDLTILDMDHRWVKDNLGIESGQ